MVTLQTLREEKLFTSGELIAELERSGLAVRRRTVMNLIGGDAARLASFLKTLVVGNFYHSVDAEDTRGIGLCFAQLSDIGKREALRAFSLFPRAVTPNRIRPYSQDEKEEFCDLNRYYASIGLWLLNWHKGNKHSDELKEMGLGAYEQPAWVSRFRYDICDYLRSNSENGFIRAQSAAMTWLLFESSLYRVRIEERYKFKSKRQRCNLTNKLIANFNDLESHGGEKLIPAISRKVLDNFAGLCLFEAKKLAKTDKGFDSYIWSKYVKAEKTWGRESLGRQGVTAYM